MRPIAEAADCRGIERQGWHPPEGETALASAGKTCYHRKDEMRGMRYAACDRRWELHHQRGALRRGEETAFSGVPGDGPAEDPGPVLRGPDESLRTLPLRAEGCPGGDPLQRRSGARRRAGGGTDPTPGAEACRRRAWGGNGPQYAGDAGVPGGRGHHRRCGGSVGEVPAAHHRH